MSEVTSTDRGSFYGSDVSLNEQDTAAGRVSFGGVSISATDAAEFVMMHRTEVLKQVGADRTEMAEKHLADIRRARQYVNDLTDLKKFADGDSLHGRAPVTPDLIDFLQNEVGCSVHSYSQRVVFYGSMVDRLPESSREHYNLQLSEDGGFKPQWGGPYGLENDDPGSHTHGRYQIHHATCIHKDSFNTLKEEVNNYIDQLNDSNNLFMTKFKNVVNTMNEALDGANSMADKSHDTVKNLVSRW